MNGQECTRTSFVVCPDGFGSFEIDCSNVVLWNDGDNVDGPLPKTYDPCNSEVDGNGGILDVFAWRDWGTYSGCRPLPYMFPLTLVAQNGGL